MTRRYIVKYIENGQRGGPGEVSPFDAVVRNIITKSG
jgi:hypothetical protein